MKKKQYIEELFECFDYGVDAFKKNIQLPEYLSYSLQKHSFKKNISTISPDMEDDDFYHEDNGESKSASDGSYMIIYNQGDCDFFDIETIRRNIDYKDIDIFTEHLSQNEVDMLKADYLGIKDKFCSDSFSLENETIDEENKKTKTQNKQR